MAVIQQTYKTITCNGPNCKNTITFEETPNAMQKLAAELPWFNTLRLVQNAAGRNFCYCSDTCEIENIATGQHNPETRKTIVVPEGANALAQAAMQAKQAEEATKALKAGGPVTLHGG